MMMMMMITDFVKITNRHSIDVVVIIIRESQVITTTSNIG